MNLKNLSVQNKTRKKILSHLKKKEIFRIFKKFTNSLKAKESLAKLSLAFKELVNFLKILNISFFFK